ncbi:hypothetical protein [Chryseobacterium sp. CT-SW4]|uniref:hypothetical protein n=1 Tax=Chryseobacterium sp. SW-1 TaxID=3157343 RepID=UPI003B015B6F
MKKLFLLMITLSTIISCTNYIKTIDAKMVNDEDNELLTRSLPLPGTPLEFNFYGDYQFDTIDKKFVFFTNADIKKILSKINKKPDQQVLFTYTNTSIYNNLTGFFYKDQTLEDIRRQLNQPNKDMGNGILYEYSYKGYNIIDIYQQQDNGILRFISVNNSKNQDIKKFNLENNNLFFYINAQLWTK